MTAIVPQNEENCLCPLQVMKDRTKQLSVFFMSIPEFVSGMVIYGDGFLASAMQTAMHMQL